MSAILSADDLNDFISPGVACIKPVETLPSQNPETANEYEVVKEGQLPQDEKAAQISLTDCLACSGCVTSAEAVLVSLQSHAEVLHALDGDTKLFVATVSPQVRASLAATYGVSQKRAGWMLEQLLGGPSGLASGGAHGNAFTYIVDSNVLREASLHLGAEEVAKASTTDIEEMVPKRPVLSSACPGWICYVEKTTPHVLPHLSRLKSPQALSGTLLKTVLSKHLNVSPNQIWHLAVMPCFDKKLEAAREELTDLFWGPADDSRTRPAVRDVDCVITAREILMLAESRGISFPHLPQHPLQQPEFPDHTLASYLFSNTQPYRGKHRARRRRGVQPAEAGTSGGYLHHILQTQLALHPDSSLTATRGRNADVIEYAITAPPNPDPVFKAARYYGFRNITNLVRKLKPARQSRMPGARSTASAQARGGAGPGLEGYAYVEVMACPGGCTNGGGQIKVDDLPSQSRKPGNQKVWLGMVDEAYFSMEDGDGVISADDDDQEMIDPDQQVTRNEKFYDDEIDGISGKYLWDVLRHWERITDISLDRLLYTTYRRVESDVGKVGGAENEKVVELAGKIGGGW